MPYRAFQGQNCSIARALAVVGERWTLLVVRELMLGRRRFEEIRRQTGVASNILTDRLETLVEHGVARRRAGADGAGEYFLTAKGADLAPVLVALMQWGDRHEDQTGAGPPRVAVHAACEHAVELDLRCPACDGPVASTDLRVAPGTGADEGQRRAGLLPAG